MSNLSDIMGGIQTVLTNGITDVMAHQYLPDAVNHFPAVLIVPDGIFDPELAFGGNSFRFRFRLICLIVSEDSKEGFAQLMDYIDPTTANKSVIKAIRDAPTLDGKADTAGVVAIENIGRRVYGNGTFYGFDAILEGIKSVA